MYVIYVNEKLNEKEKRFLIIKELSHIFLGHIDYYPTQYRRNYYQLSQEAEALACELLLPKDQFKFIIKQNLNDENECNIDKVSDVFQVPKYIIYDRLRSLGWFKT